QLRCVAHRLKLPESGINWIFARFSIQIWNIGRSRDEASKRAILELLKGIKLELTVIRVLCDVEFDGNYQRNGHYVVFGFLNSGGFYV
nr:hypothetical protein [Candidatus Brocadiales bacterium]